MASLQNPPHEIGDLSGRRVLITGASSGIGRAAAIAVARFGAHTVLVGRNTDRLAATAGELAGNGRHEIHTVDLTEPAAAKELFRNTGAVTDIIHAAGTQVTMPVKVLADAKIESVLQTGVYASLRLAREFAKATNRAADSASMTFVSSVMGVVGAAGRSAYAAAKSGMIGITRALAIEFAPLQIRVNAVTPGFVHTPMLEEMGKLWSDEQRQTVEQLHPLGFGEPEDVAAVLAFLTGPGARWITGAVIPVDGGYTAQ